MTQAWYRVASQSFGYASAAMIVVIVLLALRCSLSDRALWRRVLRGEPRVGAAGALRVQASGSRRLAAGDEIPVPYEGTLGSAHSCDVRIPYRKVHMRSAFFWMDHGELHMVALHRDGFRVDDVPVEPGDEAVLRDGAVLRVGDLKLTLLLNRLPSLREEETDEPYVTRARRSRAQRGRGEGIGAPGRGEARREKRLNARQKKAERRRTEKKTAKDQKAERQSRARR